MTTLFAIEMGDNLVKRATRQWRGDDRPQG